MKNKPLSKKGLLFGSIAFFAFCLLWTYFSRFIMFKGEPLNNEPFGFGSVFETLVASVVFYFSMGWWLKRQNKKKEKIGNKVGKAES